VPHKGVSSIIEMNLPLLLKSGSMMASSNPKKSGSVKNKYQNLLQK
jgi:hypothetical protein